MYAKDALWERCLLDLKGRLPENLYYLWIGALEAVRSGDTLVLIAPNMHICNHVRTEYLPEIEPLVQRHSKDEITSVVVQFERPKIEPLPPIVSAKPAKSLDPLFTFDNFIEGQSNSLAYKACLELARSEQSPLFLFIYGASGLGKTHLMQATCHRLAELGLVCRYFGATQFTDRVVRSLRQGADMEHGIEQFKDSVRRASVLVVDDIHILATKTKTLMELMSLFSDFIASNKRVIFAADRHPSTLVGFDDRMRGRLSQGLSVAIDPPIYEMRVQILHKKADLENVFLPAECAHYIAKNVVSDVRRLEGALKQVIAAARLRHDPISLDLVQNALKDIVVMPVQRVGVEAIQRTVCQHFGVSMKDLLSSKRARSIVRPRQMAMALCRELTDQSLVDIGTAFGGRDHTTVMHACEKVQKLRQSDGVFAHAYEKILVLSQHAS